jgi:glyoxylase-like metal-dependent hydrolase (beta-lactamase superfamily II)
VEKIKGNIYVETNYLGCNPSFVVTSNGIVMIDTPQKPAEAFRWRKEVLKYGEVAFIINTDHHQDHALGNYYFDGDIIMHEGTKKKLLAKKTIERFRDWVKLMEPQSGFLMDDYFVRMPKITYSDRMTVYLGGEVFELIHITSHTQDETIVYMPFKKVLFTGDTLCTNGIPGLHESFPGDWLNALEFLDGLNFEVLVPGHGKIGSKDSVRQFRKELGLQFNRVREGIRKGFTKHEIVGAVKYEDTVHAKYPPEFSDIFDRLMRESIGRVYDELMRIGT